MVDVVLGGVIALSILFGLIRGFVSTVVSTLSWLLSGWVAFMWGGIVAIKLAGISHPSAGYYIGGYVGVFFIVMIVVSLLGKAIKSLVKAASLSGVDRLAGVVLGSVRGAFFACLLVVLVTATPFSNSIEWGKSYVLPIIAPGVSWMRSKLPDVFKPKRSFMSRLKELGVKIDFKNSPLLGDNDSLSDQLQQAATQRPQRGQSVSGALGKQEFAPSE